MRKVEERLRANRAAGGPDLAVEIVFPVASEAIARVFGPSVPVSSLKGHLGHTMAASGSLELAASVEMLTRGLLIPTLNLHEVDPACAGVDHVVLPRPTRVNVIVKNSFAMGVINSCMVLRSWTDDGQ